MSDPQQKSWLEKLSHVLTSEPHNREELVDMLRDAATREVLDPNTLSMIEALLGVPELRVKDVMIPRSQMTVLHKDDPLEAILPIVTRTLHSRFPVVGENKDEVVGILLSKDLLAYAFDQERHFLMRDILRPATFIPENKRLDTLLQEFRMNRNHMAIVVDEYGGVTGLITIEDVLEQIVGDIEDEYDLEEDKWFKKHTENSYTVKAITTIEEFNEEFGTDFQEPNVDTLGGLIIRKLKHLPKRGEKIVIDDIQFKVLRADSRRIHVLQVKFL